MRPYEQLKKIFRRISHLQYLQRILMWDEAVMMPEGAGSMRAHAVATLSRLIQKQITNKKIKPLLEQLQTDENLSVWDKANISWMEKKYHHAICVPTILIEKMTKAAFTCEQAWRHLRGKNNWRDFLPYLEKSFVLAKEINERRANYFKLNPYDVLLDQYAPGFNQQTIDPIFATLKSHLPPLISKIAEKQATQSILHPQGPFPVAQQKCLGLEVMRSLGFDFNLGRLDVSHHPFCSGGAMDVRITTRYQEEEFLQALMAICHETGHALYEQGLPREWLEQPVGQVGGMAMHESQSLLIEMEVCRSPAFYQYLTPLIIKHFGPQKAFTVSNLQQQVLQVKPSLIRVNADEVTYPLHIILRYEIEKGLFSGKYTIKDLPDVWDVAMQKYLGLTTKGDDKNGVMQDVHWPAGLFGYFPAYTLGRLIAAQLFVTFKEQLPNYHKEIQEGNFAPLAHWLNTNVYQYASSLSTHDLLIKTTGKPFDSHFFIKHLEERYLN